MIIREIQKLRSMTVKQLQEKYEEVFEESTSARNKDYIWKKIAWRIQELKYGGLSERAKKQAEEIADEHDIRARSPGGFVKESGKQKKAGRTLPAPGTMLTRKYKGTVIEVEVLENGFRLENQIFRSLSAIAREVTGTHWNGWNFFGLKR